jgi:hypothetical protein
MEHCQETNVSKEKALSIVYIFFTSEPAIETKLCTEAGIQGKDFQSELSHVTLPSQVSHRGGKTY